MTVQIIITVVLVSVIVPLLTALLLGHHPLNLLKRKLKSGNYSADAFIECLRRNQADIEQIVPEDEDKDTTVFFRYQGGNFVGTHNGDPETRLYNTVSVSFFRCFDAEPADLSILERAVNEVNTQVSPIKATIKPAADGSVFDVSMHISGLRLANRAEDGTYLHLLLTGFFEMRRHLADTFNQIVKEDPNPVTQSLMPYAHAVYAMQRAEIEENANIWDGPWFETPRLTLASVVDRMTGSVPSDDAKIFINGVKADEKASELEPFALMLKSDIQTDDPVLTDYLTIDINEPEELMNRNVHMILRLKSVEDRLITIHAYVMQSGLPVSAFRPIGSPETLPRAFSSAIGIHRGGPELFKAEAEYMAQEQGLIDRLKNGDAAYSLYWGMALFSADRFFEAAFYLQNAYDMIAAQMADPATLPQESVEQFFDICFYLGITYYKLGRYRDSYYFLDIIVNQHRARWTQQYILTLVALRDPRLESMLLNLREQIKDQLEESDNAPVLEELIQFIDRQMILVKLQQGKIDEVRQALEARLESAPDDAFALYWLAKLG